MPRSRREFLAYSSLAMLAAAVQAKAAGFATRIRHCPSGWAGGIACNL